MTFIQSPLAVSVCALSAVLSAVSGGTQVCCTCALTSSRVFLTARYGADRLKSIRAHPVPRSACVNSLYSCHILCLWHTFLMGHTANF